MFESLFQKYPFFRVIPAVLVMALIFKMSGTTGSDLGAIPPPWDKVLHAFAYAFLAITYAFWWKYSFWKMHTKKAFLLIVLLTLLYGISDEFHQSFVDGRSSDIFDVLADTIGGILGACFYTFVIRIALKK